MHQKQLSQPSNDNQIRGISIKQLSSASSQVVNTSHLNQMLKEYSQIKVNFGNNTAENFLEKVLTSTVNTMKSANLNTHSLSIDKQQSREYNSLQAKSTQEPQVLFITKQRQQQNDQKIAEEWRDARIKAFQAYLSNKPNEQEFENHLKQINTDFLSKARQCLPIQSAIKLKINNFKVLHIEYKQQTNQFGQQKYRYQISAFQLFKLIHCNKQLTEVTIKGVEIMNFSQFLQKLNDINKKHLKFDKQHEWMRVFHPPKQLKLAIDAWILFEVKASLKFLENLKDLAYFEGLFFELSDIGVKIDLTPGEAHRKYRWTEILIQLWQSIRNIKNIKISLQGYTFSRSSPSDLRSKIFGELASFKTISQLSFRGIKINNKVEVNDLLAIEQSLTTIFQNNNITHLTLDNCCYFPIIPQTKNLQSINIKDSSFRKIYDFVGQTTNQNPITKFICLFRDNKWSINEQLFNKAQTLFISNFTGFDEKSKIIEQSVSNVKYFSAINSTRNKYNFDLFAFSNLANLTHLYLCNYQFGCNLLYIIPSSLLEVLHIQKNQALRNGDIKAIDQKWPNLRQIKLWDCPNISQNLWNFRKFKGLTNFITNNRSMSQTKTRQYLLRRGFMIS